ncbi:TetR/AcrR family transcriptional regulator [Microbacterium sp. JB110]|uniref:TetR/AcrR family transcriptional regulator n=1 Tax=unclassified Microbacterium TaxID=2609290 RepID=UPI00097F658A|nr:TetR/AcrR family transcriptional regulator [Microbacterium sp. JB110]SJM50216.1 Transcriptional regulator, TetR family [Frigoribacterium sp. JB110]
MARILEAAERVFATDPFASMEEIATAAGVARTTVHRRFSSRDELRDALVSVINAKLREAFASAHVETAPPLVALYQLTMTTLDLKADWRAAWQLVDEGTQGIDADIIAELDALLQRSRDTGLLRRNVDIPWMRSIYMALIHEAATARDDDDSASGWARLIMQTLLSGIGDEEHDLERLLADTRDHTQE